ncbi:MAG: DUF4294 domain-containing protein [Chitinophagaceae bacterium]|nr:MAG: DUF4294 domain-containing protein [Chitinophagaceae bacterium]
MRRLAFSIILFFAAYTAAQAQGGTNAQNSKWGPNDTILVQAIFVDGEIYPYSQLPEVTISKLPYQEMVKQMQVYNRLRNAVYVTYPYARQAGIVINDVNVHLLTVSDKGERKKYIKSREKELKQRFSEPLTNLSVYQGKVLMKLINRQTGNNCYEIIKEYRGGLQARLYQTVAFFVGSSLKQPYDHQNDATDRQIESIVKEIDGMWYMNTSRPGARPTN